MKKKLLISLLSIFIIGSVGINIYTINGMTTTNHKREKLQEKINTLEKKQIDLENDSKLKDKKINKLEKSKKENEINKLETVNDDTKEVSLTGTTEQPDVEKNDLLISGQTSDSSTLNNSALTARNNKNEIKADTPADNSYESEKSISQDEKNKAIQEITEYFEAVRSSTINNKREQVENWKINGEVTWSDELITTSLQTFTNELPTVDYYTHYTEDISTAKARIDKAFNDKFNYSFIK